MMIKKLIFATCLVASSFAFAQEGCFSKHDNAYLRVGAMRGSLGMCSKLPNGTYVWVEANEFDMGGGCWYADKYPVGSILNQDGGLRQCIEHKDNGPIKYEWVPYKA